MIRNCKPLWQMCQEMIALCGLSSWDTPTLVQSIVLCSVLVHWLSSTVVHALAHELIVLGWFNSRVAPALAPFLAISPLVKLLAKLLVQSNG